jgi:hypothetical protein
MNMIQQSLVSTHGLFSGVDIGSNVNIKELPCSHVASVKHQKLIHKIFMGKVVPLLN